MGGVLRTRFQPLGGGAGSAEWLVGIRNEGQRTCWLAGFPAVTAYGCRDDATRGCVASRAGRVRLIVRRGDVLGLPGRGKGAVELSPGASAGFHLKTSAAGSPMPWVRILRLLIKLDGLRDPLTVSTFMVDGAHDHDRYLVVTTALSKI